MHNQSRPAAPLECPCGTGVPYQQCCQPLHKGAAALSPERLMRSRYSAYALGLIDYLVSSTLPAQQPLLDRQAIEQWSHASIWLGLTVEDTPAVEPHAQRAQVTFTAHWADPDGQRCSHRECSDFVKRHEHWFFIDPNHPVKASRNDPCPCDSGRKFKQCCSG